MAPAPPISFFQVSVSMSYETCYSGFERVHEVLKTEVVTEEVKRVNGGGGGG